MLEVRGMWKGSSVVNRRFPGEHGTKVSTCKQLM